MFAFEACGGYCNQRVAILTGFVIASLLDWDVVLPELPKNGICATGRGSESECAKGGRDLVEFDQFYDVEFLQRAVPEMKFLPRSAINQFPFTPMGDENAFEQRQRGNPVELHEQLKQIRDHGNFVTMTSSLMNPGAGCPLFKITMGSGLQKAAYWKLNNALRLSRKLRGISKQLIAGLRNRSQHGYIALHRRAEPDWVEHCNTPAHRGIWNCFANTNLLDYTLQFEGLKLDSTSPVYMMGQASADFECRDLFFGARGCYWKYFLKPQMYYSNSSTNLAMDVIFESGEQFMRHRAANGFPRNYSHVYTLRDFVMMDEELLRRRGIHLIDREQRAGIEYEVASQAHVFVGNSVSSFAAHLFLQREQQSGGLSKLSDISYNGGGNHLHNALFGQISGYQTNQLKWVFVLDAKSFSKTDERSVKAMVMSAQKHTTVVPICLYFGGRCPVHDWLIEHGVRVVLIYEPEWMFKIQGLVDQHAPGFMTSNRQSYTLNIRSAAFMRFQLPVLGFADDFVVSTDIDFQFLMETTLQSLLMIMDKDLPKWFRKHPNGQLAKSPRQMSIYNIPSLRQHHEKIVRHIESTIKKLMKPHVTDTSLKRLHDKITGGDASALVADHIENELFT